MAHPLTHLTHGIPTRRPFHPAKTAASVREKLRCLKICGIYWETRPGSESKEHFDVLVGVCVEVDFDLYLRKD